MKHGKETCSEMFKLKNIECTGGNAVSVQTENKMVGGEAGNTMTKFCAGQVTENGQEKVALLNLWEHAGMRN